MGKVEDMGQFMKLPVENGYGSGLISEPKFKKRKVIVVRDFPRDCGQNVRPVSLGTTRASAAKAMENMHGAVHLVSENKIVEVNDLKIGEASKSFELEKEELLDQHDTDKEEGSKNLESGEEEALISHDTNKEQGSKNVEYEKEEVRVSWDTVKEEGSKDLKSEKEEEALVSHDANIEEGSKNLEIEKDEALVSHDRDKQEDTCDVLDSNNLRSANGDALVRDIAKMGDCSKVKNVGEGDGLQPHPTKGPTVSASVNGNMMRRYPPRRRVSVVRDFPLLCGNKELEPTATASSNNNSLGLKIVVAEHNLSADCVRSDVRQSGKKIMYGDSSTSKRVVIVSQEADDRDLYESEKDVLLQVRPQPQPQPSLENRVTEAREIVSQEVDDKDLYESEKDALLQAQPQSSSENRNTEAKAIEEASIDHLAQESEIDNSSGNSNSGNEVANLSKKKSLKRVISTVSGALNQNKLQLVDSSKSDCSLDKEVVQCLMAAPICPWRQGKGGSKTNLGSHSGGKNSEKSKLSKKETNFSKMKKSDSRVSGGITAAKRSLQTEKGSKKCINEMLLDDDRGTSEDGGRHEDNHVGQKSCGSSLSVVPFGVSSSGAGDGEGVTRNMVRETLRLFQAVFRKILHENEAENKGLRRVDLAAAMILKEHGKYINTGKAIMGPVPGIEVGDEFHYRVELNIIGLHRASQAGIDYLKEGNDIFATSIVASGGYPDDLENSDNLVYTGSGGNMVQGKKDPEDQKLERGNLALKNSVDRQNHVRVIRGFKESKAAESSDSRAKSLMTYTYDGLYLVTKYWQEMAQHGKLVYKFQLNRIPGQPELAWKQVKKTNKFKVREGLCLDDISQGKESIPICAVNTIDDEKPPNFEYVTSMIYPSWYDRIPPVGCKCKKGCSDSECCSCATANGGEIPFNYDGAIVEAKTLVYECGPLCKCPPSCHNRSSQRGIKFQLEIFKTETTGWGVRSLNSIPSGSFICEYIGELLEDKEADLRTGNDEYLFDIGHNYNDRSLWDGLSSVLPTAQSNASEEMEDDDAGFTIDAAQFGNVGRFVNHSCSPNLYAQNVLYDHNDKRTPHIMLFAAENIPPLQELTYHYNYTMDQVRDSNGNIKKKYCYCGSPECTGRMY